MMLLLLIFAPLLVASEKLTTAENENVQRTCGHVRSKEPQIPKIQSLLGGRSVSLDEFQNKAPWVVSVSYDGNAVCTGSLISMRHVITAAHCLSKISTECKEDFRHNTKWEHNTASKFSVVVDNVESRLIEPSIGKTRKTVRKVIFPASFTVRECPTFDNQYEDIVILELSDDVAGAQYACLPSKVYKNERLAFYGYGDDMTTFSNSLKTHNMVKTDNCHVDIAQYSGAMCLKGEGHSLGCQVSRRVNKVDVINAGSPKISPSICHRTDIL